MDLKVKVSWHQRQMLKFLADRGGSSTYRFGVTDADCQAANETERQAKQAAKEGGDRSVRQMGDELGLITITPLLGRPGVCDIRLTDAGRAILAAWLPQTASQK